MYLPHGLAHLIQGRFMVQWALKVPIRNIQAPLGAWTAPTEQRRQRHRRAFRDSDGTAKTVHRFHDLEQGGIADRHPACVPPPRCQFTEVGSGFPEGERSASCSCVQISNFRAMLERCD